MQFPAHWLGPDQQHAFTDPYVAKAAPFVFLGSVLGLTNGAVPSRLLVKASMTEGQSRWSAAWIDHGVVGYATAAADVESWSSHQEADKGVVNPTEATSWIRPIGSITQISMLETRVRLQRYFGERDWQWSARAQVEFVHGDPLVLPLHGSLDTREEEERTFAFLAELNATLSGAKDASGV